MDISTEFEQWLASLAKKHPAAWENLPDIGLYMDQVQTFIDRQLGLYDLHDQDKLLTPAMINNYIKDGLIPRAESKKYAPSHLALLMVIATLKQVQSMQNLKRLLADCRTLDVVEPLYSRFLTKEQDAVQELSLQAFQQMQLSLRAGARDEDVLRGLALDLSIEARIRVLLSEKLLDLLDTMKSTETTGQVTEKGESRSTPERERGKDRKSKS